MGTLLDYDSFSGHWYFWLVPPSLYFGRNCGNVFCAGCCHLKLPIPDQQLYDPVLVCNSCYEHIQVSRARELMSQHLKKPIATASSWMPEEMTCPFLAGLKGGGSASGVVWKVPWYGSWTQSSKIPSWEILLGTMWLEQRNLNLAGDFLLERPSLWGNGPDPDPESGSFTLSWWLQLLSWRSQDDDFINNCVVQSAQTAIERHTHNQTPSDNETHLSSTLKRADHSIQDRNSHPIWEELSSVPLRSVSVHEGSVF